MADAAYQLTRRQGRRAVLVKVTSVGVDYETGERTQNATPINVRRVVRQPINYSRLIKAQATQQDIGDTLFIFWSPDIPGFTRLEVEDYIIMDGVKFQVRGSALEGTAFVVFAKEISGEEAPQVFSQSVSQTMLSEDADPTVTP